MTETDMSVVKVSQSVLCSVVLGKGSKENMTQIVVCCVRVEESVSHGY